MAGNYRSRCCNVPSHTFSFGVLPEKKVTGILAVGLESQESDCTRVAFEPATRLMGRLSSGVVERDDNLLPLQRWWEM